MTVLQFPSRDTAARPARADTAERTGTIAVGSDLASSLPDAARRAAKLPPSPGPAVHVFAPLRGSV